MKSGAAKKPSDPISMLSLVDLPFNSADGFTTDEEIPASVNDTIRLRNETSGSGSITIYVITEDGQYTTTGLLGTGNSQISVSNGGSQERTVTGTGKYLLSKNSPPINPEDPGGSTITIIVSG